MKDAEAVHLLASVTVTVYVPEVKPDKFGLGEPLLHENLKGGFSPVTLIFIVPTSKFGQLGVVVPVITIWVISQLTIEKHRTALWQPLLTVTQYCPGSRLFRVC